MIDKFKTCKDCPDRCVSPNCHTTCEGYLDRCRKRYEQREIEAAKAKAITHFIETKQRFKIESKYKRKTKRR